MSYCFTMVKVLVVLYLVLLAHTVHLLMHTKPCHYDTLWRKAEPGTKERRRYERLRQKHCLDPFWPSSSSHGGLQVDMALHLAASGGVDSEDGADCRFASPLVTPGE